MAAHAHPDRRQRQLSVVYTHARRSALAGSTALVALASWTFGAAAADFPTHNVRIVVPSSAGGNLTIVARAIAQKLSQAFGQQVIVDNHPGGNGIIGTEIVRNAAPDGYGPRSSRDQQIAATHARSSAVEAANRPPNLGLPRSPSPAAHRLPSRPGAVLRDAPLESRTAGIREPTSKRAACPLTHIANFGVFPDSSRNSACGLLPVRPT